MIASTTEKLLLEQQESTLVVTLSNPPAHAFNTESLAGLKDLVEAAANDNSIRAIVITGEGSKFFSAGADLKLFAGGDKAIADSMASSFAAAFAAVTAFPGVTIAAINGYAMGGGLECALACDIRIAERQSRLALPEASVGLLPCGGGTQKLSCLVGEGWAKRMILCGEQVSAEQALNIGLVEQVTERGEAKDAACALAARVVRQSPAAVTACKTLIDAARHADMGAPYKAERKAFVDLFDGKDQQEGVQAFLEKRPPKWQHD